MAEHIDEPAPVSSPAIDETAATEPANGLTYVQKAPEYDPQERLDTVRAKLAFCLMGLLALVIVGAFALAFTTSLTQITFSDLRLIIELLATPVVTLVGAATGFYFGANLGNARRTGRRR